MVKCILEKSRFKAVNSRAAQAGFTLVEIMVAINLSFLVITMMISIYLFSLKFSTNASNLLDEKNDSIAFLSYMYKTFQRADEYYFLRKDSMSCFVFDANDTITFTGEFIYTTSLSERLDIHTFMIELLTMENETLIFENEPKDIFGYSIRDSSVIRSSYIESIILEIEKDKRTYRMVYESPDYGIKSFLNTMR